MTTQKVRKRVLLVRTTHMPEGSFAGKGGYRKIGVVECDVDFYPKYIREQKKGNVRIVAVADRVHVGSTARSEGYCMIRDLLKGVSEFSESISGKIRRSCDVTEYQ